MRLDSIIRWMCHNPICERIYWKSYDNICPTCGFEGEPVMETRHRYFE